MSGVIGYDAADFLIGEDIYPIFLKMDKMGNHRETTILPCDRWAFCDDDGYYLVKNKTAVPIEAIINICSSKGQISVLLDENLLMEKK